MRKTAVLLVLLALGLSSLVLVSRDSAAQQEPASSLVCPADWELQGDTCVIDDGAQCPDGGVFIGAGLCEIQAEPLAELTCPAGSSVASVIDGCVVSVGDPAAPNPCPADYEWDGLECLQFVGTPSGVTCPPGYSIDDSLGGMCARFEQALQADPSCPEGARGEAEGCYIFVARGPFGCDEDIQRVIGSECWALGDAPVRGPGTCPVAADVIADGCYRVVEAVDAVCPVDSERTPTEGDPFECRQAVELVPGPLECVADYSLIDTECVRRPDPVGPFPCVAPTLELVGLCLVIGDPPFRGPGVCPLAADIVREPEGECYRVYGPLADGSCPASTTVITHEGAPGCRQEVALVPTALMCASGFNLVDLRCVVAADVVVELAQIPCPAGSVIDGDGNCRKPVATAAGAYFCPDLDAALNGLSCVFVAPFILGECVTGEERNGRCFEVLPGPPVVDCGNADVPPPGPVCAEIEPLSVVECPPGTFDVGAGGGCYGEADAACDEAVAGRCVRFVAPVLRGQISGKVRDITDGSGLFGVQVCARNDFLGLESCSFSQGDGTYYLPPLPPGNYQLRAVDFSQRYEGGCFGIGDCADPAWVGLGLDMERDELSIWLEPSGLGPRPTPTPTVHGSVTPTPTAEVPTPTATPTATPTPTGPTATPTPTPETPTPTPTATPMQPTPTAVVGTPTPTPTSTPTIPDGDPPFLAGRIFENRVPINGVEVCAEPLALFFAPVCVTSGPHGAYLLEGLVSSNYHIVVEGGEACYGVDSSCDAPQLFGVTPSTAISDLTIELPDVEDLMCPAGYEADIDLGDCVRYEEPVPANGSVCPAGVRGVGNDCFIYVAKGPVGDAVCLQGTLIGDFCVIQGADPIQPPDADFVVCPDAGFVVVNGRCVVFQSPINPAASCPVGSVEDAAGDCRRAVAALVVPDGSLDCAAPDAELIDDACVIRYQELPEPFESCPFEFVYNTDLGSCARYEAAQVADPARCPETAFGVAGACTDFVAKGPSPAPLVPAQCPGGSFENVDGNCIRPVNDVVGTVGELYCSSFGAVLSGDACFTLASLGTARPSEDPPACPVGYSIDDGLLGACARFAPAVDGSCPDPASALNGQSCVWAFARWTPPVPAEPSCGPNYSIDTGLDGACARFGPADFDGEVYSCSGDGVVVSGSCIYFEIAPGGPESDADCAALNPDFPYFHEADGLCYANPIGVIE